MDPKKITTLSIGQLTELEAYAALQDWTQEFAPFMEFEEALALHIRRLEVNATYMRGGRVSVTVSILANKAWQDTSQHATYYTTNGGFSFDHKVRGV